MRQSDGKGHISQKVTVSKGTRRSYPHSDYPEANEFLLWVLPLLPVYHLLLGQVVPYPPPHLQVQDARLAKLGRHVLQHDVLVWLRVDKWWVKAKQTDGFVFDKIHAMYWLYQAVVLRNALKTRQDKNYSLTLK